MTGATVTALLREAATGLAGDSPRLDAELLLAHALGQSRAWLYAHAGDGVDPGAVRAFGALVERRRRGEPIAQLTGRREFWSLSLAVSADTLIPRPETELLVELALARLPAGRVTGILDLGTGTGAIALALARERPQARITAVDASAAALAVARANAAALGLGLRLREGDWFEAVAGERFDLVASNPPYLADDDPHLALGDLRFEPRSALASGPDGLDDIRRIAGAAPDHLHPGGWLLVEHGWQQGEAVRAIFSDSGLQDVATERDLEGRERVTLGRARPTPG